MDKKQKVEPKVVLGIPWVALGMRSLFSDSGFILIYEALCWMNKLKGAQSLILLEPRYRETFEGMNDAKETGVYAVYEDFDRLPSLASDGAVSSRVANDYISGRVCPVDFILTNKKMIVPQIAAYSDSSRRKQGVPLYFHPLFAGIDGSPSAWVEKAESAMRLEAAAYMTSSRVMWTTEAQRSRGLKICRKLISASETKRIKENSLLIGGGILPLVRDFALTDAEVKKNLQSIAKDFRVSYVGRMTGNKNVDRILDAVFALFARHSIKMEVVSTGDMNIPPGKRVHDSDQANHLIAIQEKGGSKGRKYYAQHILPRLQCVLYASTTEGHPSVPREVIYAGVPCLLPDREWSRAMFKDKYPFYYESESEMVAYVKKIREGRVTDEEVEMFNSCRKDGECIEFMDETALRFYNQASEDLSVLYGNMREQSHDKVLAIFEKKIAVGEEFKWTKLTSLFLKEGVTINYNPRVFNLRDLYCLFQDRVIPVKADVGLFRRIK